MILLVDDDASFLETLKNIVHEGRRILMAPTAARALQLLDLSEFSVALIDLDLPDCNGFELIKSLRAARPRLPIIAISGVFSPSVLESAKLFGAQATLSKPPIAAWREVIDGVQATPNP